MTVHFRPLARHKASEPDEQFGFVIGIIEADVRQGRDQIMPVDQVGHRPCFRAPALPRSSRARRAREYGHAHGKDAADALAALHLQVAAMRFADSFGHE